eukprot:PhM_4_TR16135/c2_g2_i3/m.5402
MGTFYATPRRPVNVILEVNNDNNNTANKNNKNRSGGGGSGGTSIIDRIVGVRTNCFCLVSDNNNNDCIRHDDDAKRIIKMADLILALHRSRFRIVVAVALLWTGAWVGVGVAVQLYWLTLICLPGMMVPTLYGFYIQDEIRAQLQRRMDDVTRRNGDVDDDDQQTLSVLQQHGAKVVVRIARPKGRATYYVYIYTTTTPTTHPFS